MKLRIAATLGTLLLFVGSVLIYFDMFHDVKKIEAKKITINEDLRAHKSRDLIIQFANGDTLWANRGYTFYKSADEGRTFKKYFRIPIPLTSISFFGNSDLLRNQFRTQDISELKILKSGTFIIFAGGYIFRSSDGGNSFDKVGSLRYFGMGEGRGVLPQGIAEDKNGNIYFGEYLRKQGDFEVTIYKSTDDGLSWEPFYSFPPGKIRHIHAVQYDPYGEKIWVATGDRDHESKIGYFRLGSNDFTVVFSGSQKYRAVSLQFSENFIYWGMDAPSVESFIYRMNRYNQKDEKLKSIGNPAYYSYKTKDGLMLLGTVVEHIRVSGDPYVKIFMSQNGIKWEKVMQDLGLYEGRGHAFNRFPRGETNLKVFTFLNTDKYHNSLIVLED